MTQVRHGGHTDGVGFIGMGEAAVTPAGVASADGVAESHGAGVEDECDSSDPLSDGGTGLV
jgi:hypothetical protein